MNRAIHFTLALVFSFGLLLTAPATAHAKCVWEGKAPACNGKCRAGFKLMKMDKKGNGKKCLTGKKAYCCPNVMVVIRGKAPFCNGKCKPGETRVGDSKRGEKGKKCRTGKAAQCINPAKK